MKLLMGIKEIGIKVDPSGGVGAYVKPRAPTKDQPIESKTNVALVSYKIASVLPNTVSFNFLKDWRAWFTIENHEKKKYRAYIKIKFIMSDGYEEDAGGYYGGNIAWRLNALSGIIAPGLGIPEKIREKVKQGKGIKIRILGEIKDENDNLVEKKLPVEYIYDPKNNSWYLEP